MDQIGQVTAVKVGRRKYAHIIDRGWRERLNREW